MKKMRNSITGALGLFTLFFPLIASAQWTVGQENMADTGLPVSSVYGIIGNTVSWLLAVLGFIAIIGFVISGIQYLTSAGDEGQIDTAKTNMKYCIVGVIVALMGYVVTAAVNNWLAGSVSF